MPIPDRLQPVFDYVLKFVEESDLLERESNLYKEFVKHIYDRTSITRYDAHKTIDNEVNIVLDLVSFVFVHVIKDGLNRHTSEENRRIFSEFQQKIAERIAWPSNLDLVLALYAHQTNILWFGRLNQDLIARYVACGINTEDRIKLLAEAKEFLNSMYAQFKPVLIEDLLSYCFSKGQDVTTAVYVADLVAILPEDDRKRVLKLLPAGGCEEIKQILIDRNLMPKAFPRLMPV